MAVVLAGQVLGSVVFFVLKKNNIFNSIKNQRTFNLSHRSSWCVAVFFAVMNEWLLTCDEGFI